MQNNQIERESTPQNNFCLVKLIGNAGAIMGGHPLQDLDHLLRSHFKRSPSEDVLLVTGTGTAEILVEETMKLYRTLEQEKGIGQVSLEELQRVALHQGYETRIVQGLKGISYFTPQELVELGIAQSGAELFQKRYA